MAGTAFPTAETGIAAVLGDGGRAARLTRFRWGGAPAAPRQQHPCRDQPPSLLRLITWLAGGGAGSGTLFHWEKPSRPRWPRGEMASTREGGPVPAAASAAPAAARCSTGRGRAGRAGLAARWPLPGRASLSPRRRAWTRRPRAAPEPAAR